MDPGSRTASRDPLVLEVRFVDPTRLYGRRPFALSRAYVGRIGLLFFGVLALWADWHGRTTAFGLCAVVVLADFVAGRRARRGAAVRRIVVDESRVTWPFEHGDERFLRSGVRFVIEPDVDQPRDASAKRLRLELPRFGDSIPLVRVENFVDPVVLDSYFPNTPESRELGRGDRAGSLEMLNLEQIRERLNADEVTAGDHRWAKLSTWAIWVVAICIGAPILWWSITSHGRDFYMPVLLAVWATDGFDGLARWARLAWTRWNVRRAQPLSPAA